MSSWQERIDHVKRNKLNLVEKETRNKMSQESVEKAEVVQLFQEALCKFPLRDILMEVKTDVFQGEGELVEHLDTDDYIIDSRTKKRFLYKGGRHKYFNVLSLVSDEIIYFCPKVDDSLLYDSEFSGDFTTHTGNTSLEFWVHDDTYYNPRGIIMSYVYPYYAYLGTESNQRSFFNEIATEHSIRSRRKISTSDAIKDFVTGTPAESLVKFPSDDNPLHIPFQSDLNEFNENVVEFMELLNDRRLYPHQLREITKPV